MASPRPAAPRRTPLSAVAQAIQARVDTVTSVTDVTGATDATDATDAASDGVEVLGVTMDSRDVVAGDLYAALPGSSAHGASFATQAVAAGAVAVLTDDAGARSVRDRGLDLPVVICREPRAVLGQVASLVYGTETLPLRMLGVTGTNGKTTTAYLLCSALEALGQQTGLIGTVETRIGSERIRSVRTTPETTVLHALLAVMAERRLGTCAMEVSSHALVQHRVDGLLFDLALFTNLSRDHLEFHPTMRDYFEAKASLFTPERARAGIVCVDDVWGRELAATTSIPVTTMTTVAGADAHWHVEADDPDPQAFVLRGPGGALRLRSALPGEFNRANTAMAALTLLGLGFAHDDVERALAADPHVPGRMERVEVSPDQPLAVVDYAHTPDAVAAALQALRPQTAGRLVVVLGAGGDRDPGKREAMGEAAAQYADVVVVTDDNPRSEDPAAIRSSILAGTRAVDHRAEVVEVAGRGAAIRRGVAEACAAPGSTLAVVGKGHETGQDVAGEVHPFDDRDEVRAALLDELGAGPVTA